MRPSSEMALLNTNGRYSVMKSDFGARLYWAELKSNAVNPQKITRCAERERGGIGWGLETRLYFLEGCADRWRRPRRQAAPNIGSVPQTHVSFSFSLFLFISFLSDLVPLPPLFRIFSLIWKPLRRVSPVSYCLICRFRYRVIKLLPMGNALGVPSGLPQDKMPWLFHSKMELNLNLNSFDFLLLLRAPSFNDALFNVIDYCS